ncbi:MAG: class II glutamine amidotransferase [Proteobacteria bacterium]|nr:class II glutamine amidotransferase [Pseudomonadota bacterium]
MCELFAISSRLPATVSLSLETLAEHGGGSAPHADGWGIAYYRGDDARVIKDTSAAHDSDWVRFVQSRGLSSTTIISHIRKATRGGVRLQNTHPFARELGGRMHVLAHNGTLEGVFDHPDFALGRFRPIGETDSEHAFCNLLARMEGVWLSAGGAPPLDRRLAVFTAFATQARALGAANFLYADGDTLFVQADKRYRQDGGTRPPGLHMLNRRCRAPRETVSGGGVSVTSDIQAITLLASVPLTDEDWQPLPKNTILALSQGEVVARLP